MFIYKPGKHLHKHHSVVNPSFLYGPLGQKKQQWCLDFWNDISFYFEDVCVIKHDSKTKAAQIWFDDKTDISFFHLMEEKKPAVYY